MNLTKALKAKTRTTGKAKKENKMKSMITAFIPMKKKEVPVEAKLAVAILRKDHNAFFRGDGGRWMKVKDAYNQLPSGFCSVNV